MMRLEARNPARQKMNRREFHRRVVQSTLAASSLPLLGCTSLTKKDQELLPIVDTHQHLWDLKKVHPPWLKPGGELTRDYVTADYLEATDPGAWRPCECRSTRSSRCPPRSRR